MEKIADSFDQIVPPTASRKYQDHQSALFINLETILNKWHRYIFSSTYGTKFQLLLWLFCFLVIIGLHIGLAQRQSLFLVSLLVNKTRFLSMVPFNNFNSGPCSSMSFSAWFLHLLANLLHHGLVRISTLKQPCSLKEEKS